MVVARGQLVSSLTKEYGPVFQLRVPGAPTINMIWKIEDIEKMYKVTFDNPIRPFCDSIKVANQRCPSKFYKEGEYGLAHTPGLGNLVHTSGSMIYMCPLMCPLMLGKVAMPQERIACVSTINVVLELT